MKSKVDISVDLAGIKMKNPLMPASGTWGFGEETAELFGDNNFLGAQVSKGTTLDSKAGNKQRRVFELPFGMLNRIGLENPGVDRFVEEKLPFMRQSDSPIIVNVSGNTEDEFLKIVEVLNDAEGIAGLEINISCPNINKGGLVFGTSPPLAAQLLKRIRINTDYPLIVKLTPNVSDDVLKYIAVRVVNAGADAISLVNTFTGAIIDPDDPKEESLFMGGVSGPAIKALALWRVYQVCQVVNFPVIGMGGISSAKDVVDFIRVGATAVAVGTACFTQPGLFTDLIDGLEKYCLEKGYTSLSDFRGKAKLVT